MIMKSTMYRRVTRWEGERLDRTVCDEGGGDELEEEREARLFRRVRERERERREREKREKRRLSDETKWKAKILFHTPKMCPMRACDLPMWHSLTCRKTEENIQPNEETHTLSLQMRRSP
jgi:hypothetical protein